MKHAGTVWMGMDAVMDYEAEPLVEGSEHQKKKPQLLVISCTRDFAYSTSNKKAWQALLPDSYERRTQFINFENCRHYPFYEEEALYGKDLREFLSHVEKLGVK